MSESILATDGYKFSMAEAGWPLRQETFYYSHRKGGWQVIPFDIAEYISELVPEVGEHDYAFLSMNEYEAVGGFKSAFRKDLHIRCLPEGAWFYEREPIFSITGPSAFVSWFEPLVLMMNFRIQVATLALTDLDAARKSLAIVTCDRQKAIILETLDWCGIKKFTISVLEDVYYNNVKAQARGLIDIVGDPNRIFEVGMRAASCMEQHEIALKACKDAGISRTSNVYLAKKLRMIPVGTMGHEHVQRYGSDRAAFRAMVDRRYARSSFLLDTFDTLRSGIPAAFDVIEESGYTGWLSIRYDSGDKEAQYRAAHAEGLRRKISPVHILEDGFDADKTWRFEALRKELGISPSDQHYGYGGYLVGAPSNCDLTRDRVSAVWKLSKTGATPTMKFGDEANSGKESIPGEPVLFRNMEEPAPPGPTGIIGRPMGIIGQNGEPCPSGYVKLTLDEYEDFPFPQSTEIYRDRPNSNGLTYSPETYRLMSDLRRQRDEMCK